MILRSFLFAVFAILLGCVSTPIPALLSVYDVDTSRAFTYLLLCSAAFVIGYLTPPLTPHPKQTINAEISVAQETNIPRGHMMILLVLALSGLIVVLVQINETVGLAEYLSVIGSMASSNATNILRGATITLSSSEGGLPGYIKVFEENVVIAPFCILALLARGVRLKGATNITIAVAIAVIFVLGALFRMDRLSLLALTPVTLSILRRTRSRSGRLIAWCCVLSLAAFVWYQSLRRGSEFGLTDWIALYFHSGMLNLGLMIGTVTQHTFGLEGPLSFISWLFLGAGVHISPTSSFDFIWSPAQNGFGYTFQDFGWLGIAFWGIAGNVGRRVEAVARKTRNERAPWQEIRWVFAFAMLSLASVPAYRGPEFWLLLLLSTLLGTTRINHEPKFRFAIFSKRPFPKESLSLK